MNKSILLVVSMLGIILLGISVIYFITPANNLPSFFPGHEAGLMKTHMKHGIGALLLGLGCFILVWFQTGKKSPEDK